jgi:hypothetical protein
MVLIKDPALSVKDPATFYRLLPDVYILSGIDTQIRQNSQ